MPATERMATLAVIDYEALANKDIGEIQKLVQACRTAGIFHLNLRDSRMNAVFEDIPTIFKTGEAFFTLPQDSEEKKQSLREGMERGYHYFKGYEYYEIAREEYASDRWLLPASFEPQKETIARTINSFNRALQTVITELCAALDFNIPELGDDPTAPGDTGFKLVYKAPLEEPGHAMSPWHTDSGLATLLWNDEVMTQIQVHGGAGKREEEDWETVPVIDGAVLINIADELAAKSGGRLHSPVHRVVSPPGDRRVWNGAVYHLRPYKTSQLGPI